MNLSGPPTKKSHTLQNITHAAGASASADGFRVEARASPDAWEIVSLDESWYNCDGGLTPTQ